MVEENLHQEIFNKGFYLSHHLFQLFYIILIVLVASVVTYLITSHNTNNRLVTFAPPSQPEAAIDAYVESGSPLDNRAVDPKVKNQVIFHGPRDKKKIALTFDTEMTEGMKANVVSGRVKSSYDKRIIDILNQTQTPATLFLTGM